MLLQGTLTPLNPTKALAALKHKWEHHFDKQVTIRCLAFTQFGCNTHEHHVVFHAITGNVSSHDLIWPAFEHAMCLSVCLLSVTQVAGLRQGGLQQTEE